MFQKILEALMVGLNLEALPQGIRAPQLNGMQNSQHLFFINGFAQIPFRQLLAGEGQRSTLLHKETLIPFPEASDSNTKVFVKSGRAKTKVVHMVVFKV